MKREPAPSLCEHWMPDDGSHVMSNTCWCQPILDSISTGQGAPRTTVRHRPMVRR